MSLLIIDDIFPYEVSGFRLTEILYLMDKFPNSKVISTLAALNWLKHDTSRSEITEKFSSTYPHLVDRVMFSSDQDMGVKISQMLDSNSPSSLMYCLFLNNAENLLNISEKFQVPFVFTLYPGGAFILIIQSVMTSSQEFYQATC